MWQRFLDVFETVPPASVLMAEDHSKEVANSCLLGLALKAEAVCFSEMAVIFYGFNLPR
jgi:hypothetical protein